MLHLSKEHAERRGNLSPEHARGFDRFRKRLLRFQVEGLLRPSQVAIVVEHLLRLGERERNPANTGNIEDLFCHTLMDTSDAVRAYAQALADSVKVIPMAPQASLWPPLKHLSSQRIYYTVGELTGLSEPDQMLVAHTMVAYGDEEMWQSALEFVHATHSTLSSTAVEQEVSRMAVQSQHLPSSSFVLARAHGITIECSELWHRAGYDNKETDAAQAFYDICAQFETRWANTFINGLIPTDSNWVAWRAEYLRARSRLPSELIYQLSSDTLTNFLEGTLESGKWTDASVAFHGVRCPELLPSAIARIVNQYIAEHVGLHDRPAYEIAMACARTLEPWGVVFENGKATVSSHVPPKASQLKEQFNAAQARLRRSYPVSEGNQ